MSETYANAKERLYRHAASRRLPYEKLEEMLHEKAKQCGITEGQYEMNRLRLWRVYEMESTEPFWEGKKSNEEVR